LCAQQSAPADSLKVSRNQLEKPFLWKPFRIQLQASGGTVPYHWRIVEGSLPRNMFLNDNGMLTGVLNEPGPFQFTVLIRDNSSPPKEQKQQYLLRAEVPLTIDWKDKARIDGQRIDGSITASNNTGRDLDLTFIVLAVNDIGRATAIGYQHFALKSDTKNMELPFGDTLSPGNYEVNVDVVGEEPISKNIFRTRLVAEKKAITQGP
jgi:Putative Ig domain